MRELVPILGPLFMARRNIQAPERVSKREPVPLRSVPLVGAERAVMRR